VPNVPAFAQVFPIWIQRNNQGHLLDSKQAFDLLLARDCIVNVAFEVDPTVDLVARRKTGMGTILVFEDALFGIAGNTGV
jgi:hypothetical protein